MVKRRRTTRIAATKPRVDPAPQPQEDPAPQAEAPAGPTRESVLGEIRELMSQVDALMEAPDRGWISMGGMAYGTPIHSLRAQLRDQVSKLADILHEASGSDEDVPDTADVIAQELGVKRGEPPKWSHPGEFLVWIGYVPCRVVWPGFDGYGLEAYAADPALKWLTHSGYCSLGWQQVLGDELTVADMVRRVLTQLTEQRPGRSKHERGFDLVQLTDPSAVAKTLELPENAWLVEALRRGPVDPIPLPKRLHAVQQTLFA